ncbi:MAG: stage II sporulation protein R [Evtepia sp.]
MNAKRHTMLRQGIALLAVIVICAVFWLDREQGDLSHKLVRLHVLANSDTQEDQALKRKVRDRILLETGASLKDPKDICDVTNTLRAQLPNLEQAASEVIQAEGYPYPVSVELKETWFPTRQYDGFALPAGNYEALRVLIGEGRGQNWWCVVFPPLCVAAASETFVETATATGLSSEEISLVSDDEEEYVIKFRAIELWETLKHQFAGIAP